MRYMQHIQMLGGILKFHWMTFPTASFFRLTARSFNALNLLVFSAETTSTISFNLILGEDDFLIELHILRLTDYVSESNLFSHVYKKAFFVVFWGFFWGGEDFDFRDFKVKKLCHFYINITLFHILLLFSLISKPCKSDICLK